MKKLIFLATLMPWSCTSKPAATDSHILMTPTASAIPKRGAHVGIYRITDEKNGKTIAFIPKYYNRSLIYQKHEFSKDWKNITIESNGYVLKYEEDLKENTELEFLGGNKRSAYFGTLSKREKTTIISNDCSNIQGIPVFDNDIFKHETPLVGEELYIISRIKNPNPLPQSNRYVQSRLMNFKLGAILAEKDNKRIILTAKTNQLQDFYLFDEGRFGEFGNAVFSKKTHQIVGFLESINKTNGTNSSGKLNLGIISILSQNMWSQNTLKDDEGMPRAINPIKTSVGKEWKETYCSPNNVAKIIDQVIVRENRYKSMLEFERRRNEPTPTIPNGKSPPWKADYGTWCVKKPEDVLKALEKAVSRQDQAHAAAAAVSPKSEEAQTPPWDYIMSEHLPEICPREVHEAIAARIGKDKEDKNCRNNSPEKHPMRDHQT